METKRLYECLYLIDPALAAGDWDGITGKIKAQIEKRGGEVVSLKKWDERQLAYQISDKTRGTYILVYFNCETAAVASIERDINLSEDIMRAMILRADFISSEEQMDKKAPTITDLRYRASAEEGWNRDRGFEDAAVIDDIDDVEEDEVDDDASEDDTDKE